MSRGGKLGRHQCRALHRDLGHAHKWRSCLLLLKCFLAVAHLTVRFFLLLILDFFFHFLSLTRCTALAPFREKCFHSNGCFQRNLSLKHNKK